MACDEITVGDIAAASTVVLIHEDGSWKWTSHRDERDVAAALVRIGLAIEEGAE